MNRHFPSFVPPIACCVLALAAGAGFCLPVRAAEPPASAASELWVYVGTYTRGNDSQGIYVFRLQLDSGKLTLAGTAGGVENPSFLALHPSGKYLYAVGEVGEFAGKRGGAVAAFEVDARTGQLKMLNAQSSEGAGPCHVSVDKTGKVVLVANYGGGSVASLPVQPDGQLKKAASAIQHQGSSANPKRQEGPHAHSINVDPANQFAVAADLGLDKVMIYRLHPESGEIEAHDPPFAEVAPGSGPRHFAFHPSGKFAYVINEMLCTVTAFAYDAKKGTLEAGQTITTLPEPVREGYSTAEVQVHPSGRFLYGSNRGHDSIAIFKIDPSSGKLTAIGHQPTQGKTPRNFGIDPTGKYLLAANQTTGNIVVFQIDPETGELNETGVEVKVPAPVCVKFLPVAGK